MKQKILTISVIFIILGLFLIIFLIYPLFKGIKKNSEDLILEKRKLVSIEAEIKNLRELEGVYQSLKPNLEKIDKLLINPDVPVDFIKFLEKTALDSKTLIKISPVSLKTIKTDSWPSLRFQISLTGSFSGFLNFLRKIESSSYLIEIYNLNLRELTKNKGNISGTLLIKVYTK